MGLADLLSFYAYEDKSSSSRLTYGIIMLYNKAMIMSKSKMQKTTALSMTDAEYFYLSAAGCEVL